MKNICPSLLDLIHMSANKAGLNQIKDQDITLYHMENIRRTNTRKSNSSTCCYYRMHFCMCPKVLHKHIDAAVLCRQSGHTITCDVKYSVAGPTINFTKLFWITLHYINSHLNILKRYNLLWFFPNILSHLLTQWQNV